MKTVTAECMTRALCNSLIILLLDPYFVTVSRVHVLGLCRSRSSDQHTCDHESSFHTLRSLMRGHTWLNTLDLCFQGGNQVLGIMCLNKELKFYSLILDLADSRISVSKPQGQAYRNQIRLSLVHARKQEHTVGRRHPGVRNPNKWMSCDC